MPQLPPTPLAKGAPVRRPDSPPMPPFWAVLQVVGGPSTPLTVVVDNIDAAGACHSLVFLLRAFFDDTATVRLSCHPLCPHASPHQTHVDCCPGRAFPRLNDRWKEPLLPDPERQALPLQRSGPSFAITLQQQAPRSTQPPSRQPLLELLLHPSTHPAPSLHQRRTSVLDSLFHYLPTLASAASITQQKPSSSQHHTSATGSSPLPASVSKHASRPSFNSSFCYIKAACQEKGKPAPQQKTNCLALPYGKAAAHRGTNRLADCSETLCLVSCHPDFGSIRLTGM